MNRIRQKKYHWIGGSLIAFGGVALVRLLAPELIDPARKIVMTAGYLLVILGLMVIGLATRRKGSEAYLTVKRDSGSKGEKT